MPKYRAVIQTVSGDTFETEPERLSMNPDQKLEILTWFFENVLRADGDWVTFSAYGQGAYSIPESQIKYITVATG